MNVSIFKWLLGAGFVIWLPISFAGELEVVVYGVKPNVGQVGCSLFTDESGFPMDAIKAKQIWVDATNSEVHCKFTQITNGKYAVAVMQDMNLNKKVDTNFVGIPKEPWGVSNNIRPNLRAPKFSEAMIEFNDQESRVIQVEISK